MVTRGTKEKLVIVGSGMAATAVIEEILKADPERFEITVFGAEKRAGYNRVLLSHVLTGEKTVDDISIHAPAWYADNGIKLHVNKKVSEIRRKSRMAVAEDGTTAVYNKLVLALGSVPIIPDIPGSDLPGVFSFRTIDDCERIRGFSGADKRAVVIGGGLLGLEAAWALKELSAEVTVVHLMDRLMERQLDESAASLLKADIERLGIQVLLNKETVEIRGDGRVQGLLFRDGSAIPADAVVMSLGIRPNAALPMSSGIYTEKGVVVSDTMQTYDPAVFAIGECVQHRGATFGLVASVFEQAKVLANHLAGNARLSFKPRPVSARLKVPSIDLFSAGSFDMPGAESIVYSDASAGVYKRLSVKDGRVKGIILYGETLDGPPLLETLLDEADITDTRRTLLAGGGGKAAGRDAGPSIDDLPDTTIVCGCNGVTKGMIVEAIEKKGLFTREDVKRETKASSSCGGCGGLVDRILEATLGANFQGAGAPEGLCACTKYTRDDVIKNIREKELKSVNDVMETLGWENVGCDTCRPAINYYVRMVWPEKAEDDRSSRLINERMHANIQKDGAFSVVPRVYGGVITTDELKRIATTAERYNVPLVKITGGQRIGLFGIKKDDLPGVWNEIGLPSGFAYAKALRTVKTCVGSLYCRYGTQDSLSLGISLEKRLEGLWMPAKVKLGVNGCPRNCAESEVKDVGITGIQGGFRIFAGGSGGIELKGGELLAEAKTGEEAVEIVSAFIQQYREEAHYGERTFKWVRRAGIKAVKKNVVEDLDARKALVGRLEKALSQRADPWDKRGRDADAGTKGRRADRGA